MPAGQTLTVAYEYLAGDGVITVLDNCPVLNSCLASADVSATGSETLSWTNTTSTTNTVTLVLDNADDPDPSYGPRGGDFTLDITIE